MRKPKLLLALLAGVMLMAFLPIDDAAAQQRPSDPASRAAGQAYLRKKIDNDLDRGIKARAAGQCEGHENARQHLEFLTTDEGVRHWAREWAHVYLPSIDRLPIREYARQRLAELQLDCPPKGQTAADAGQSGMSISAGGGPAVVDLSQITSGTAILTPGDPGSERPTAKSDGTLTGESANILLEAPVGRNLRAFLGFTGSWFEGSSDGETDGDAANTYIFANPENDSTGVAFPGGQVAAISSEGRIVDVTAGVTGTIFNLGGPPPLRQQGVTELAGDVVAGVPVRPGGVAVVGSAGFRYRNLTQNHSSFTEALLFIDDPISANTNLETDSNFFGGQIGAGLTFRAPYPDSALFGGISGTVALGETSTDGSVLGKYRCVPCGAASPEFDFLLRRNFDDSNFSAIYGGEAFLGVATGNIEFRVFATVEHMTNVPVFAVPFTPVQQPIRLVEDDLTNATFGVRANFFLQSNFREHGIFAPSDARLKRDIVKVGRLASGVSLYRYRYLWSDAEYVGVMAQEVAKAVPEAVARGADGYLRVDYGRLGTRLMTLAEWSAAR